MRETLGMNKPFDLLLFSSQLDSIRASVAAGVAGIVVDWERAGKQERQAGSDTQINLDTPEDLVRVRRCTAARVLCRINGYGPSTSGEIQKAIALGADEILLPMVRRVEDVEAVLAEAQGRCGVGILVETAAAVGLAEDLARLPLTRVYVGLNDLAIDRGTSSIFAAVLDGTVESVRKPFRVPFGFGGVTLPWSGYPIPSRLLIAEMARLDCDFGVLRRSFLRDIRGRDPMREVPSLLRAIEEARRRSPERVAQERSELEEAIRASSEGLSKVAGALR